MTGNTTKLAAVGILLASMSAPAVGQEPFVVVPDAPGGARVTGCYRADRDLFGPNRLTFCLERRGTYRVRGGVHCDGTLTWNVNGNDITVNLNRTSCRNGVAWERARMACRATGSLLGAIIGGVVRELAPRVPVPSRPSVSALRCTYMPSVRGYRDTTFIANRT
jgi:hypothetical protein